MKSSCKIIAWLVLLCCTGHSAIPQSSLINVHHVTPEDGLSDGVIRSITQDKYGYIWMASLSGLSRYDGYSVKLFQNRPGDPGSFPYGFAPAIFGDRSGNLWIGMNSGVYRFNYENESFQRLNNTKDYFISSIMESEKGDVFLLTNKGLTWLDTANFTIKPLKSIAVAGAEHFSLGIYDFACYQNHLYITTPEGVIVYNTVAKKAILKKVGGVGEQKPRLIAIDSSGSVFFATGIDNNTIIKSDITLLHAKIFPQTIFPDSSLQSQVLSVYSDRKGRVWITTSAKGVFVYDKTTDWFRQYTVDPGRPNGLRSTNYRIPYSDRDGFIWLAMEGSGVDYFHPDNNLFELISSFDNKPANYLTGWARAIAEDEEGNLWMGWGEGLVRKSPSNQYKTWTNKKDEKPQLYSRSVRSLLNDEKYLWIGTGNGVNRYVKSTGEMQFLGVKDSLPFNFYWAMFKDHRGTIWFGNNYSLHYWNPGDVTAHPVKNHPVLGKARIGGVKCFYEDSRKNLWIGSNGYGLFLFNQQTGEVKKWKRTDDNDTTIVGNDFTSITEDKNGIIWLASTTGMVSYDYKSARFTQYTNMKGIGSGKLSCLTVDKQNRLWVGSPSGLLVIDSSRKRIKNFDVNDGLPTLEFNDQNAFVLKDGRFVYPSVKGFVLFDPESYSGLGTKAAPLISGISVFNKPLETSINAEALSTVSLKPTQNFFSIRLVAVNYANPRQTWFAYKLDGFDKDWIFTKETNINYTNVPGGHYTFRYKATTDPSNLNVEEKTLSISIGTPFYKTVFFWTIMAVIAAIILYLLYKSRLKQQQRVFYLKSKAQLLEKEKALVQYENLKQQLNPHFLFNSLTSLGSLIRVDQKGAGDFLDRMSKIYRYILKSRDSETVTLADELKFVAMYIELQKTRFNEALEVRIDIEEESLHRKIAPVTLQNLVENAIKHNIADKDTPLIIEFFVEDGWLVVRNNLQKKKFVETSNKQGLANMKSLYHYLSSKSLQIIEDDHYFTVKIPLT